VERLAVEVAERMPLLLVRAFPVPAAASHRGWNVGAAGKSIEDRLNRQAGALFPEGSGSGYGSPALWIGEPSLR
jgi:hypothetical protein